MASNNKTIKVEQTGSPLRRQHTQRLTIQVVDHRRQEQQSTDEPAKMTDGAWRAHRNVVDVRLQERVLTLRSLRPLRSIVTFALAGRLANGSVRV